MSVATYIDSVVPPSGNGCVEWAPAQHASRYTRETGHPIIQLFEPGRTVGQALRGAIS
jgi:hypothetical protein